MDGDRESAGVDRAELRMSAASRAAAGAGSASDASRAAATVTAARARTASEPLEPLRLPCSYRELIAQLEHHVRRLAEGRRGEPLAVLEAGCGRQWPLDVQGLEIRLTGVDMDAAALGMRTDLDCAIVGDLRDAQLLPRGAYDLIYNSFVLEHVDGAERVLENFVSWLRPGGLLILRFPDRESAYGFAARMTPFRLHVLYKRWIEGMPDAGKPGFDPYPTHYDRVITRRGIREFCSRHGCRILEEYGSGFYMRGRLGLLRRIGAIGLWTMSLGRLAWRHNNLTYVIRSGEGR